jgi:hypothetical protein
MIDFQFHTDNFRLPRPLPNTKNGACERDELEWIEIRFQLVDNRMSEIRDDFILGPHERIP